MRQRQKLAIALGVMVVLGGLSPVMAADPTPLGVAGPERQSDGHSATPLTLSEEQLDNVHAGRDWTSAGALIFRAIVNKNYGDFVDAGGVVICDEGGPCKVY